MLTKCIETLYQSDHSADSDLDEERFELSMKAKVITVSEEEGLELILEIEGIPYEVMDCMGYYEIIHAGQMLEVEFRVGVDNEDESLDEIFCANPERAQKLVCIEGWSYRAYGKIISVDPCIVCCGDIEITEPFELAYEDCLGKYVAFDIDRMDVWLSKS